MSPSSSLRRLVVSSTFRLAMLYLAMFAVSVLLVLGFVHYQAADYLASQTDETIDAEIQGLREQYAVLGLRGLARIIEERTDSDHAGNSVYLLTDWRFMPLAGNLPRWPMAPETEGGRIAFTLETTAEGPRNDVVARHFLVPGNFHLLVGRDIGERLSFQATILRAMAWGTGVTLLLGLVGGILLSRGMLRRLDVINRFSRRIMTKGELDRRLPLRGSGDEFDTLAMNLNGMLDRIEDLMAGIRQVSDNIAHDLRTPLSRMRTRLEVCLMQETDAEAYREAIGHAIAEADAILATFRALLTIARTEAGSGRTDFTNLDLAAVVRDLAELYEPVAEDAGVRLETRIPDTLPFTGNRHLLSQALSNLLDNALKYGTPAPNDDASPRADNGPLTLSLEQDGERVRLVVADGGPGIPEDKRSKVTDRFYRLEESRSAPGSGLGLSLVKAVASLHGGELAFDDNAPGLRATLDLPTQRA